MKKIREISIPMTDHLCDADRMAFANPWALPLLESLLRREVFEADSREMSEWYIDLLEEVEQEYRLTFPQPGAKWTAAEAERNALRILALLRKNPEALRH